MTKPRVGVAFGGRSSEREISLLSGKQVYMHLPEDRYVKAPIFIDSEARFWKLSEALLKIESTAQLEDVVAKEAKFIDYTELKKEFDIIFPVMHGPYGEDGTIQGLFEMLAVPYVGSGVRASANAMHKITAKILYREAGLPVARDIVLGKRSGYDLEDLIKNLGLPIVVKPMNEGSSVGITIAKTKDDLATGLATAFSLDDQVLLEEYIKGLEITVGVFGTAKPIGFPVIEIVPKKEFFDLEAKYDPQLTDEICPARIPDSVAKQAQEFAVRAHIALGCRTFSRTDMIIHNTDQLVLLETNTIPGMTSASLLPKAAKAHGWSFPEFLEQVIRDSLGE